MLCPHADDGAITAACLIHEYAVRRGLPVIEVLVFAGERNVAAPWLNDAKKITVREGEFRLECNVLGAEGVCWNLEGYNRPGYQPTEADIAKVVDWFTQRRPGAVIVPPANDAHVAHRVTRALAAIGLVGANLSDTLVLTGWTPWGPLPQPNAYFTYDGEAERTKEWAIHCHASQVLLTDYTQYCSHLGRAYAALTREWAEGHSLAGRAHRDRRPVRGRRAVPDRVVRRLPMPGVSSRPDPARARASWAGRSPSTRGAGLAPRDPIARSARPSRSTPGSSRESIALRPHRPGPSEPIQEPPTPIRIPGPRLPCTHHRRHGRSWVWPDAECRLPASPRRADRGGDP